MTNMKTVKKDITDTTKSEHCKSSEMDKELKEYKELVKQFRYSAIKLRIRGEGIDPSVVPQEKIDMLCNIEEQAYLIQVSSDKKILEIQEQCRENLSLLKQEYMEVLNDIKKSFNDE